MDGFTEKQIINFLNFLLDTKKITVAEHARFTDAIKGKDIWMSTIQVAEMLNVSPRTVIRNAKKGVFHSYKVGDTNRYLKSEILKAIGPLELR